MKSKMIKKLFVGLAASTILFTVDAEIKHKFIAGCFAKGGITFVNESGQIEKYIEVGRGVQDTWLLKNGNIFVSWRNGVKEISPDGTIAWSYESPRKDIEIHSAQPLENGNVLILECGSKHLYEVNRDKKVTFDLVLDTKIASAHTQFRAARKTEKGTYWVAFTGEAVIREIDKNGAVLNEFKVGKGRKSVHGVIPLPGGNLLVSTAADKGIKEFDKNGVVVWEMSESDIKNAGVTKVGYTGGMQRLDNGNTIVAMYGGDPQFIEITKDKKLVWSYSNSKELKNVAGITLLDPMEKVLK